MTPFTIQQWIVIALVFLLGLVLGMSMLAGGRWKRRYQDERERSEALEAENARLRTEAREMESLRHAAAKSPPPGERGPL
jgi:hypothetical protein